MASIKRETKKRVMKKSVETDSEKKGNTKEKTILNLGNKLHDFMREEQVIGSKAMNDIMKLLFLRFIQPLIKPNGILAKLADKETYVTNGEYKINDIHLQFLHIENLLTESFLDDDDSFRTALVTVWDILHKNNLTKDIFKADSFFSVNPKCLYKCLYQINTVLKDIDFDNINYDFKGVMYEHFINGYADKGGKEFGQFFTPRSMIKLIRTLSKRYFPDEVKSIYDPCMGTAGFLTEMYKEYKSALSDENVFGGELEPDTFNIALMNMMLHTGSHCKVKKCNSLHNNENVKYNLIGTNPPFGMKHIKYDNVIEKCEFKDGIDPKKLYPIKTNDGSALFLQHCIGKLSNGGVCNIVLPDGQLLSGKTFIKLRKHLLTTCNLVAVLCAPSGAFTSAGVKTAVLIFSRKVINDKPIPTEKVDFYTCDKECKEYTLTGTVTLEQFEKSNYSLDYNMYVVKEEKTFTNEKCEMKTLGEVCNDISTNKNIASSERIDGLFRFFTCSREESTHNTHSYEGSYIIHGSRGSTIVESVFITNNEKFAIGTSMFISEIKNENDCLLKYIYYYFKSNPQLFEETITGSAIPMINKSNYYNIQIPIPSLETQQQIIADCELYERKKNNLKEYINILKQEAECLHRLTIKPLFYKKDVEVKTLGEVCDMSIKGNTNTGLITNTGEYPFYKASASNPSGTHNSYCFDDDVYILFIKSGGNVSNPLSLSHGIGKVYLVQGKSSGNTEVVKIINNQNSLIKYLYYYLQNEQLNIQKLAKYSTGLGHISMSEFKSIQIPIPSLEVQQKIIQQYDKIYNAIDKSEKIILQYEDNIKLVFDSTF